MGVDDIGCARDASWVLSGFHYGLVWCESVTWGLRCFLGCVSFDCVFSGWRRVDIIYGLRPGVVLYWVFWDVYSVELKFGVFSCFGFGRWG